MVKITEGRDRRNGDSHSGLAVVEERIIVVAKASCNYSEGSGPDPFYGSRPVPEVH